MKSTKKQSIKEIDVVENKIAGDSSSNSPKKTKKQLKNKLKKTNKEKKKMNASKKH